MLIHKGIVFTTNLRGASPQPLGKGCEDCIPQHIAKQTLSLGLVWYF